MGRIRFQTAFVVFLLWVGRWVSGVGAWGRRLSVCRVSDLPKSILNFFVIATPLRKSVESERQNLRPAGSGRPSRSAGFPRRGLPLVRAEVRVCCTLQARVRVPCRFLEPNFAQMSQVVKCIPAYRLLYNEWPDCWQSIQSNVNMGSDGYWL